MLGSRWSAMVAFERISSSTCRLVALFALGNVDFTSALVFSPCSGEWVLPVEYSDGFFGTRALLGSTVDTRSTTARWWLWTNFSFFYVAVNSNPEGFVLHSVEWSSVHSRCFWLQFLQRGSHVETWTLFLQVLHF